jgi:hypothetical protein
VKLIEDFKSAVPVVCVWEDHWELRGAWATKKTIEETPPQMLITSIGYHLGDTDTCRILTSSLIHDSEDVGAPFYIVKKAIISWYELEIK